MHDLDLSHLSFPQGFQALYQSQACPAAEASTPVTETLEALFLQWPLLMLASGQPLSKDRPGLWTIDTASGLPVFTFSTGPAQQVATVVFPAPEQRIGARALRYWCRRQVQDFWFCETDGWRRKDAEATWLRHIYRRTIRRLFSKLPRFLALNYLRVQEALVRRVLARRGRLERPAVWYPLDDASGRTDWTDHIARDNQKKTTGIIRKRRVEIE